MKKAILFLFFILGAVCAQADDTEPSIHFFQKDSILASFLRSEVDSMTYSYLDMDSVRQNTLSTHVIHLKDNRLYRIPFSKVDSVVFSYPPNYPPSIWTDIMVKTNDPIDLGTVFAVVEGEVIAEDIILEGERYGFYYGTDESLDESSSCLEYTFTGTGSRTFYGYIPFIEPETTYYYRAYITYNGVYYWGDIRSFTTMPIIVKTYEATGLGETSVHIEGELMTKDALNPGDFFGFVIDTTNNLNENSPGVYDMFTDTSPYTFYCDLSGLEPETTYYYRAFITNMGKFYWGEVRSFTTKEKIENIVKTLDVTDVGATSAHAEGELINENMLKENESFGFYYDTKSNPDESSLCVVGTFTNTSTSAFSCDMLDLEPETTYYYRAFITYNGVYYWGDIRSFRTLPVKVITYNATNVEATTAHIEGELLTRDALREGELYGFFVDTNENPDPDSPCVYRAFTKTSSPRFAWDISELEPNTTYYYRAFVKYKDIIYTGDVYQFTTEKNSEETENRAYAVFDLKTRTLTFRYDAKQDGSIIYDIETKGWKDYDIYDVKKVVFDTSFAKYLPFDTSEWFYNAFSLSEIVGIENLNTINVTDMSGMFYGCSHLTSLDLSSFDTSSVTNMSNMFLGCRNLTEINLSHFDTSNVTNMSGMFGKCSALTSLDLSNFNTSEVTNMDEMFSDCTGLTQIDVSSFDTHKVTSMRYLFNNCNNLESIDLSGFNTSEVIEMTGMFNECHSLTSLNLSSFDTSKVKIMGWMFHNCKKLKTIIVSQWSLASVSGGITAEADIFSGCYELVGGSGTKCFVGYSGMDYKYAHIDGGPDNPGYFTGG